jgi:hypothetical protein
MFLACHQCVIGTTKRRSSSSERRAATIPWRYAMPASSRPAVSASAWATVPAAWSRYGVIRSSSFWAGAFANSIQTSPRIGESWSCRRSSSGPSRMNSTRARGISMGIQGRGVPRRSGPIGWKCVIVHRFGVQGNPPGGGSPQPAKAGPGRKIPTAARRCPTVELGVPPMVRRVQGVDTGCHPHRMGSRKPPEVR